MLVLTRKLDESVFLQVNGVTVKITVTDIDRSNIRLGFAAPKIVKITRSELFDVEPKVGEERQVTCSICNDPKCDTPNGKH